MYAPRNFPPLRKFALTLLGNDTTYPKRRLRSRRKNAERLPQFRAYLLGLVPKSNAIALTSASCKPDSMTFHAMVLLFFLLELVSCSPNMRAEVQGTEDSPVTGRFAPANITVLCPLN
jgi:hypothetical protein